MIRLLNADEIECRVGKISKKGCVLLLYKNARCDMRILDEAFGTCNWQRTHEVINDNLFCNIDIWDDDKKQWIRKQDVGIESYTEKEKGEASDSFKRAGFNIGIGRELYTAPFIWVALDESEVSEFNGKVSLAKNITFDVDFIEYNDKREIVDLSIKDNKGNIRFSMKKNNTSKTKNVKPNVKPDIKPDIKPDEDAIIKKEPIIKANIDWDKIDKAMSKISTLGGLKEYWSHNKDMQTMDEFKNLKDKHKTRIDGITNK